MRWWRPDDEPILVDLTQLRLVMEIAASQAARIELAKQLEPIFPGCTIEVGVWDFSIPDIKMEPFDVLGRPVVFA